MENAIKDRFIFTYESGVTGSFLVASTSKNDSIVEFQVSMLSKNPNKHILSLDVRRNNDKINLYYNVTSKLSLSQYLRRSQLSKNEFIDIFSGLVKTLLNSKGLLLSENSFLLEEEHIYISPDTMCISLVYLPVKLDVDITKALKDFAMNFVVYSANIYEDNSDGFLQQFLSFLKKDTFNILDFDKFLKEIKRSTGLQQENESQKPLEKAEVNKSGLVSMENMEQKESDFSQNKLRVDIPKPKTVVDKDYKKTLSSNNGELRSEGKKSKEIIGDKNILKSFSGKPNVVIGTVLQAIIVIIVLVLVLSGKLDSLGNDKVSTVFGLLLISAAASYFMWKNVLKMKISENKVVNSKAIENKPIRKASVPKTVAKPSRVPKISDPDATGPKEHKKVIPTENTKIDKNNILPKLPPKAVQQEQNRKEVEEIKPVEAAVKINSNLNETVFLGSSALKNPHLQIFVNGSIEDVVINKPSFVIGRLEEQVDYVHSNNAIGKVHAEIITRSGYYYLKDLNSRNGTYLNGKRIESNKEYEIKNNDKITLANSEFVFIVL